MSGPVTDNHLMNAFKEQLVSNLTAEGIAAIRPKIREAAEAAVRDINISVNRRFDTMGEELVIGLLIKERG